MTHFKKQFNNHGIGFIDGILATAAATGIMLASAGLLSTNIQIRGKAESSKAIQRLQSAAEPAVIAAMHNYLRTLKLSYSCHQSAYPLANALSTVTLPHGETLHLYDPTTLGVVLIGQGTPAFDRCANEQTWKNYSDLSSVNSFYFCMKLSGSPEFSEAFIEFTFQELNMQSNTAIDCSQIGDGLADLQRLELKNITYARPTQAKAFLASAHSFERPLSSQAEPRDHESNAGLVDTTTKTFYLDRNGDGKLDYSFDFAALGAGTFIPVSGNFDGDSLETYGVGFYQVESRTFFLKNDLITGGADRQLTYSGAGANWKPLTGRWTEGPLHGVGLYDPNTGTFHLDTALSQNLDTTFTISDPNFDSQSAVPFSGDWNGTGKMGVALMDKDNKVCFKNSLNSGACDGQILLLACYPNCVALAGNVDRRAPFDSLHAYAPAAGVFYWLNRNVPKLTWDGSVAMGPSPSPWAPVKGFWNGRGD